MMKNSLFLILIFMLASCGSDDSAFIDRAIILKTCEEVDIKPGDSVVANTQNPEDTLVVISHNLDNKKTLKVLKGEVKLTRAQ